MKNFHMHWLGLKYISITSLAIYIFTDKLLYLTQFVNFLIKLLYRQEPCKIYFPRAVLGPKGSPDPMWVLKNHTET